MNFTENNMNMETTHTGMNDTYMCFLKQGRGIGKIAGPVFEYEIKSTKQKFFSNPDTVQVLSELSFRSRYPKRYQEHISTYWMDKLFTYFALNQSWIGKVYTFQQDRLYTTDWFQLFETTYEGGERILQLDFHINADEFKVARLMKDLNLVSPIKTIHLKRYYQGNDGHSYFGHRAVSRHLAETVITTSCLQ